LSFRLCSNIYWYTDVHFAGVYLTHLTEGQCEFLS
jgi:hypothetical protein